MSHRTFKLMVTDKDMPVEISQSTKDIIQRISKSEKVIGILFFVHHHIKMSFGPQALTAPLGVKLPQFSEAVHRAITEIDITDEITAYRIECKTAEIVVVGNKEFGACVIQKQKQKKVKKVKPTKDFLKK